MIVLSFQSWMSRHTEREGEGEREKKGRRSLSLSKHPLSHRVGGKKKGAWEAKLV